MELFDKIIEKDAEKITNEINEKEEFVLRKRKSHIILNSITLITCISLLWLCIKFINILGILLFGGLLLSCIMVLLDSILGRITVNRKQKEIAVKKIISYKKYKFSDIIECKSDSEGTIILKMNDKKKIRVSMYWDENWSNLFDILVHYNKI